MGRRKRPENRTGLTLDPTNPNRHTERGMGLLETSLRQLGAGRGILATSDGVVIAGNATLEQAVALGIPVEIVDTDPDELLIVQRDDMAADDPRAVEMRLADNAVGAANLNWDRQVLQEARLAKRTGDWFAKHEADALLGMEAEPEPIRDAVAEAVVDAAEEATGRDDVTAQPSSDTPKLRIIFRSEAEAREFAEALGLDGDDHYIDGPAWSESLAGRKS